MIVPEKDILFTYKIANILSLIQIILYLFYYINLFYVILYIYIEYTIILLLLYSTIKYKYKYRSFLFYLVYLLLYNILLYNTFREYKYTIGIGVIVLLVSHIFNRNIKYLLQLLSSILFIPLISSNYINGYLYLYIISIVVIDYINRYNSIYIRIVSIVNICIYKSKYIYLQEILFTVVLPVIVCVLYSYKIEIQKNIYNSRIDSRIYCKIDSNR
ncbi:hypothetical protein NEOKW01_1065 [Nematocida sp. AWRm80]|nr:hypothetical protein NEOKW01_1065 [Nematocida sp. AWRm80]